MKVLVTGGAGFIGSHLVEALLGRGDDVWVIDDLSTGRKENIAHLEEDPRFHWCYGSVLDNELVRRVMTHCDLIFHLAAAVGVKYVVKHPLKSLVTNIKGSEVVLEEASVGRKKVILFPAPRFTGRATPFLSKSPMTACLVRLRFRVGATPPERPLTSFSPLHTGARRACLR